MPKSHFRVSSKSKDYWTTQCYLCVSTFPWGQYCLFSLTVSLFIATQVYWKHSESVSQYKCSGAELRRSFIITWLKHEIFQITAGAYLQLTLSPGIKIFTLGGKKSILAIVHAQTWSFGKISTRPDTLPLVNTEGGRVFCWVTEIHQPWKNITVPYRQLPKQHTC